MKYTPTYSNIQLKRGTADRWVAKNPILLAGEVGLELVDNGASPDTYKVKIGDGVNTWTQLPYYGDTQDITSLVADNVISDTATINTSLKATSEALSSLSEANPPLMVGGLSSLNLAFDGNEIQARNNGLASSLFLQPSGGTTHFGSNLVIDNGSVTVSAGGSLSATINSSGYAAFPRQPSFRALRSTPHVTATGAIIFNNVFHNTGGAYNSTNGRFTAPVAGKYLVTFTTLIYEMGTSSNVYVRINGVSTAFAGTYAQFSGSYAGQGFSTVLSLNANDYIDWYFNDNGANLHEGYTHASAHLLG